MRKRTSEQLKGGLLISSMVGINERTTMDMDTTVTGISMEENEIEKIIREILLLDVGDGIEFVFDRLEPIREDDDKIEVMAYNIETIIAEKYETIIRRNIGTSRARDFYDLYMFYDLYRESINTEILKMAVARTAKKRNSLELMSEWPEIIADMKEDMSLKKLWENYCKNNAYASEVSFDKVMETALQIASLLNF